MSQRHLLTDQRGGQCVSFLRFHLTNVFLFVIALSLRLRGRKEVFMSETIIDEVRLRYGAVAVSGLSNEHDGVRAVAEAFGYSSEELASIPAGANMGLSCGNPTATARLREGETVVDLGSGGGLDVFLAAAKVGPSGRAIGIDMTPEMIELARRNAAKLKGGAQNIEFHQATIDQLPLGAGTVDCVISNCVINLALNQDNQDWDIKPQRTQRDAEKDQP